jgi:predicted ATPase
MITKWKLFNFKCIHEEKELDFAPLTIFAGPNSSGKSTILQSILLISQTLSNTIGTRTFVLNGSLAHLGQFDDLRSFDSIADQIMIGWECTPRSGTMLDYWEIQDSSRRVSLSGYRGRPLKKVTCEVAFDTDPSSPNRDFFQLQPRLNYFQMSALTRDEDNIDLTSQITVTRNPPDLEDTHGRIKGITMEDNQVETSNEGLDYDVKIDPRSLEQIKERLASAQPVGCKLRHFLPEILALRINKVHEEARIIASSICEDNIYIKKRKTLHKRDILISLGIMSKLKEIFGRDLIKQIFQDFLIEEMEHTLQEWAEGLYRLPVESKKQIRDIIQSHPDLSDTIIKTALEEKAFTPTIIMEYIPQAIREAINYMENLFSNSVKYLGPLRDEPKALYPLTTSSSPADIGLRGEYTAAVLDLHKNKHIQYIPTTQFKESAVQSGEKTRTLETAVIDWLKYLGISEHIQSKDKGKLGHELKVTLSKKGKPHDLTHAGVGVSQVLPILVLCLLADSDTTIILEQPELHLHPKVQTLLGDFFLSMSMLGKQCIIETHSEYLINRLRYRLAAAPGKELTSKIKMYFVEKKENNSIFRDVEVNEYGAIKDWPEGFFDQSQMEAEEILRAATIKRKIKQKSMMEQNKDA